MKHLFLTSIEFSNAKSFIRLLEGHGICKSYSILEQTLIDGENVHILTNMGEIFTIERKYLNEENRIDFSDIVYGMWIAKNIK